MYAIVIRDEETGEIALVRDVMGVRPLYYGENEQLFAFASEKKALWKIGLKEPTFRIHPGSALIIMPNGTYSEQLVAKNPVTNQKIRYRTLSSAIEVYKAALISSMKKRTQDLDRIGIIFSGGIDSVIIAWLAKKMVREVICYTGGVQGSSDIAFARRIAKRLDLKLKVNELTHEEVEEMIPDVINTIEHTNSGQVEVAIPVYALQNLLMKTESKSCFPAKQQMSYLGGTHGTVK